MTISSTPRVCVVGAGSSGIATAKVLHERGIAFDCYELSDRVGGNWVWKNSNGVSASYRSLHINTSRQRMEFSDFPMPSNLPDFARHDQVAAYFDAYVDHFGLCEKITFNTGVEHIERRDDGRFDVTLSTGERRAKYDSVCVANGHHWDPRWPEPGFPGADTFAGEQMHSHALRRSRASSSARRWSCSGWATQRWTSRSTPATHAAETYLAARRGAHVIPKYILRAPLSTESPPPTRIPAWLSAGRMARAIVQAHYAAGDMETYGLQKPNHQFAQAHPTMSSRILDRLAHGTITPKPNITHLDGDRVHFADGTSVECADLVVYCTGYKITFPFFDRGLPRSAATTSSTALQAPRATPNIQGLYFIGLIQPLGAIMPIAERQSQLDRATTSKADYGIRRPRARCNADIDAKRSQDAKSATSPPSATRSKSTSTTTCASWPRNTPPAPGAPQTIRRALPSARRSRPA